MYLKKSITLVATVLCVIFFVGCGGNSGTDGVTIKRFEKVIFGSPADELPENLKKQQSEYAPLISGDLNDPILCETSPSSPTTRR